MFPISQQVQLIEKGLRNEIWHIFHGIKYDLKITLMITDTEMLSQMFSSGLEDKHLISREFFSKLCYFVTLVLISAFI